MTYISIDDVRRASGAPAALITDAYITAIIEDVEPEMERWLNTKFTGTERIDILDGTGNNTIFTQKNPLLAVRAINTNDTDITISDIDFYTPSGKIVLSTASETGLFLAKAKDTKIKYIYGMIEESTTKTSSTADMTAGSAVNITVASITGFTDADWCEIHGMDGTREAFQISGAPSANTIVADQLLYAHESGSTVVLLQIPFHIKRYMEIEAAIAVSIYAIGSTYTFNASYSLGELSVVKGVPYTHWRESTEKLMKEREMRRSRIKPRMHTVVS